MNSKNLPAFCSPGTALRYMGGIVIHYFSAQNVDPDNPYDLEACRHLFIDLNRPRDEREWYMRSLDWGTP